MKTENKRWMRLGMWGLVAIASCLFALALSACGTLQVGIERTPTAAATAVATLAEPKATSTVEPSPAATATVPPSATPAPSATPEPQASPTPTAENTPAATVDRVKIALIALDDNGQTGKPVGCGDSVVAVERQVAPTQEPLRAALQELFSLREQFLGQSGLYNALHQAQIVVESATATDGKAVIRLSGSLLLGGVCDDPRAGAQIEETALLSPGVQQVTVFLNDKPLSESLSEK